MVKFRVVDSWMASGKNLEEAVCSGIVVWHDGKEVVLAPEHNYLRIKGSKEELCRTHFEVLQRYVTQGIKRGKTTMSNVCPVCKQPKKFLKENPSLYVCGCTENYEAKK